MTIHVPFSPCCTTIAWASFRGSRKINYLFYSCSMLCLRRWMKWFWNCFAEYGTYLKPASKYIFKIASDEVDEETTRKRGGNSEISALSSVYRRSASALEQNFQCTAKIRVLVRIIVGKCIYSERANSKIIIENAKRKNSVHGVVSKRKTHFCPQIAATTSIDETLYHVSWQLNTGWRYLRCFNVNGFVDTDIALQSKHTKRLPLANCRSVVVCDCNCVR